MIRSGDGSGFFVCRMVFHTLNYSINGKIVYIFSIILRPREEYNFRSPNVRVLIFILMRTRSYTVDMGGGSSYHSKIYAYGRGLKPVSSYIFSLSILPMSTACQ